MELLKIMEPYITGTTSILGIFFIQVMWITIFRVTLKEKMTEKKYHYLLELSSGIIMSIFSIYLLYMSQKENYYYLYSNLRLVIILLPTIFISARVSFISVFLAGVFSFFINGITLVSVAYIVTFSVFLLTVAITKKLVKGNQIKLFFLSCLFVIPIWFAVYFINFDGVHVYSLDYMVPDYLNFVIISSITFFSVSYLAYLSEHFFQTMADNLTDELTKLGNLKAFNQLYPVFFQQVEKNKYQCNLILFDIDHFKQVNDTYGHLAGNYVLVELANLLKQMSVTHYGNRVFRIGGEEFALLIENESLEETLKIANEICEAVANYPFYYDGRRIKVSISLGVACSVGKENQREFYMKADKALYQAKELGRNQVSYWKE